MKILCVGDVVGTPGLDFLCRRLPGLKRRLGADLCIVNGENAHPDGVGIAAPQAEDIFAHGADVITTGNHALRRAKEELFEDTETLLCPANLPYLERGAGCVTLDLGRCAVTVLNLSGVAFLEPIDNPFDTADRLLADDPARFKIIDMIFGSDFPDKGVRVTEDSGKLVIELHIKVTYGLNISAIVKSITHKVKYVVEDATGLQVKKINVSVDDIVS